MPNRQWFCGRPCLFLLNHLATIGTKEKPRIGAHDCVLSDDGDFNESRVYCTNIVLPAFIDGLFLCVAVCALHQMNNHGVGLEDVFALAHDDRNDGVSSGGQVADHEALPSGVIYSDVAVNDDTHPVTRTQIQLG